MQPFPELQYYSVTGPTASFPRYHFVAMQFTIKNEKLVCNKFVYFFIYLPAETKCMKALPDCDVPRAVCASRTHSGKVSFICYCKPGFTGRSSQCIGNDVFLLRMQLLNLTVTTFSLNHTAFFVFQMLMNVLIKMLINVPRMPYAPTQLVDMNADVKTVLLEMVSVAKVIVTAVSHYILCFSL